MKSKPTEVIFWPEFRIAWVVLVLLILAFVVDIVAISGALMLLIEGGILVLVFALTAGVLYGAASTDRGTKIERSELTSILASVDDALIVYDSNFRAIFFNPAAERLFKIPAKDVLGHVFVPQDVEREGWRTLIQVIFPSLAPRVMARSKEGEQPLVADLSFADPQLELRATTAPVNDDSGNRLAFMKIIRDRTPQIAAMRARTEFVTVASHQLRGPVTDINWALESLMSAQGISETDKSIVQNAAAASKGLLRRIDDLLNLSKMEEGQFGYEFKQVNIIDFLSGILADVLPAARKAGVKMYFDRPSEDLPPATIDAKRLSFAMSNILENAIRYNVENGEVTVKVDRVSDKPFLEVTVKDTGIGVPPEAVAKLFTKFYRADNAVRSQTEGSGLGLYIAKGIVNAHGGEIWAESELNRGTSVHFTLPTDLNLIPRHEAALTDEF